MTHACYLLRSLNPRFKRSFYIGCTTDPRRRLRQHNGEVGQGAHFTKAKRPWEMVLCVYGFSSHVNALQIGPGLLRGRRVLGILLPCFFHYIYTAFGCLPGKKMVLRFPYFEFEWAWQHPFVSLAVREAAAKLPSLKGVPGMITLVCTMVTLPNWNSLNLTLQFMLSSLLQHRQGSPPLPPQMRLVVAPIHSLPAKDSEDGNDDNDDLSTCPDDLSQSGQLDEDSYLNASACAVDVQAGVTDAGLIAELYTTHDITSSPCPKTKGKKSRKGKTPQGRKGKRGATHKPSEDSVLIDLQFKRSGSRTLSAVKEISSAVPNELNDCSVLDDSRMTLTVVETTCTSSGSQGERIDCYWNPVDPPDSSAEERIPSYLDSKEDSHGSVEIGLNVFGFYGIKATANETAHSGSQGKRAGSRGFSKLDLIYRSIGERISLLGTPKVQSYWLENRAYAMTSKTSETASTSHSSQGQRIDSSTVSEDLSSWSISENVLSESSVRDQHSKMPIVNDGDSLCASSITGAATQAECVGHGQGEKIGSHAVSDKHNVARSPAGRGERNYGYGISNDLSGKCTGERIPSDGISENQSRMYVVRSCLGREGDVGAKQKSDSGDSDIEEISVEEFAVHSTRSTEGDASCILLRASDNDIVQTSVREKNLLEEKSGQGVDLRQKSLKTFFPVRKQGTVPTSIYRKARNGDMCKVLEDNSNTRTSPIEVVSKEKSSEIRRDFKSSSREIVQDATLIIDSDDDDDDDDAIQEISVAEFKHGSLTAKLGVTGKKGKVCSLNNFR